MAMEKQYNPQDYENAIYAAWKESGFFHPENLPGAESREPFSVMMPPPNVTGVLHLGHALENTLLDAKIRFERMRGKRALLLPGTDHAAVATQAKVEGLLKDGEFEWPVGSGQFEQSDNPRQEFGRDGLLERIRGYAEQSKSTILNQIEKMGTSADWDRLAYTFDEPRNRAVNELFVRMYEDGLIYRGYRVVNWSVVGQSTCSDDELVYVARPSKLYTFRYSADFPIPIATTRPETKLGDTAVAVHPEGKWKEYIGQTFEIENFGSDEPGKGVNLTIKIIADENVDPEFGTGALGVTPAHSQIDYEMYLNNPDIGLKAIIGKDGRMTGKAGGAYRKKTVEECREAIVKWLREAGLMVAEEEIEQNVATSDRFKDIVEAIPMEQWFIDVNKKVPGYNRSLKYLMHDAVTVGHTHKDGSDAGVVEIVPHRFLSVYENWINSLKDWNISRQIWWGHRIPAYYDIENVKNKNGKIFFHYTDEKVPIINEFLSNLQETDESWDQFWGSTDQLFIIDFVVAKKIVSAGLLTFNEIKNNAAGFSFEECKDVLVTTDQSKINESHIQDPDTLDTWFSSGSWTFSTLGWKGEANPYVDPQSDLSQYQKGGTSWMQMGHEILFFWMARMILMTTYALDDIPFKRVYIHGILRDKEGKKFSKSSGNGIDPLDVIAEYGTDALRMSLIKGVTPGNDARFYEDKVVEARNFVTKLWNAARLIQSTENDVEEGVFADQWMRWELDCLIEELTKLYNNDEFGLISDKLYSFFWDSFANQYLEMVKTGHASSVECKKFFFEYLQLLHPVAPFITELLNKEIFANSTLLLISEWPKATKKADDLTSEVSRQMQDVFALCDHVRFLRKELQISNKEELSIKFGEGVTNAAKKIVCSLVRVVEDVSLHAGTLLETYDKDWCSWLQVPQDLQQESSQKKKEELTQAIAVLEGRLANPSYSEKAPAHLVQQTRDELEEKKRLLGEL